jgi:hypothetical protein
MEGNKPVQRLSSIAARAVAEFASSLRGPREEPTAIVTRYDAKHRSWKMRVDRKAGPCSGPDGAVTPLDTPFVQPGRPGVTHVGIRAEGMHHDESLIRYDAGFWSEAAVEKFVFPYYASKAQWTAAHVLTRLSEIFYGYVPDGVEASNRLETGDVPFAIGHIPRSDYAALEEHDVLGDDLFVVFRGPQGEVKHRPLSEFL